MRPKQNYTHISIILDRSGSMAGIANDIMGGFNTFIETQKTLEGKVTISLVQFDHSYDYISKMTSLDEIVPLTRETYVPRGLTALNDAFGRLINETTEEINKLKKAKKKSPTQVLFVAITDGYENASKEFTAQTLKDLITKCETEKKWEFVYIGANQDSFAEGNSRGVSNSMNFTTDSIGVKSMYASISSSVINYRSKGVFKIEEEDTKEQRAAKNILNNSTFGK